MDRSRLDTWTGARLRPAVTRHEGGETFLPLSHGPDSNRGMSDRFTNYLRLHPADSTRSRKCVAVQGAVCPKAFLDDKMSRLLVAVKLCDFRIKMGQRLRIPCLRRLANAGSKGVAGPFKRSNRC